ncbi:selenoneine biosynthesis selenosugar synthase SenB [Amycolatopsis palatopharyngis]|uniref:selenoneine biosynthesis selenosugar synthase SenB n=1 Tax=Amycolatopsis palatopharyngis TaxID=187982 RepID=UPI001FE5FE89|nr:selenoneine biosynthesis selenosugar synthase SenB [Amycolatopsis palatopharyngis]
MILLVSPATSAATNGNSVTVQRWAGILRALGHEVDVAERYRGGEYAALVALHARKSEAAIRAFHAEHPAAPVVVALTGTDLYPDLAAAGVDPAVLRIASRLIVLQPHGLRQLDITLRARATVMVQSMSSIPRGRPRPGVFEVAVLANLRAVKDPSRAAAATRMLPERSRIRVSHAGAGLEPELVERARSETRDNPKYEWLGALDRADALSVLARSQLLLVTSKHEGGANVISEALAAGVPVLSSAIAGSQGLLGDDYPGYFAVGDTAGLAELMFAAEVDRGGFYGALWDRCDRLRTTIDPRRERDAWASLLNELSVPVVE